MSEFYYNTVTGEVEEGKQSASNRLMGPYESREEASRALEIAAERNAEWERENLAWDGESEVVDGRSIDEH